MVSVVTTDRPSRIFSRRFCWNTRSDGFYGLLWIGSIGAVLWLFLSLSRLDNGSPSIATTGTGTLHVGNDQAEPSTTMFSSTPLATTTANRTHDASSSPKHAKPPISLTSPKIPLQVFVLAGQSNVMGKGYMDLRDEDGIPLQGTLKWMVNTLPERYGKLQTRRPNADERNTTKTLEWTERADVWITNNRQDKKNFEAEIHQHGNLVAGYGGLPGSEGQEMGPELGFGWAIGDALLSQNGQSGHESDRPGESKNHNNGNHHQPAANALIIKVAWGQRSLGHNFRPPSAGKKPGNYYGALLANVRLALSSLPDLFPGYSPDRGYELAGLAWHQGWTDSIRTKFQDEYESNLACLIRDLRTDLEVPRLPVVIGVSGMDGWEQTDEKPRAPILRAQFAVANATLYPEFAGTVQAVETRDFYRKPRPESPGREKYHWNNNCESYWLIGEAMGKAMIDLVTRNQQL